MENHQFIYPIFISFITALALVSISLCIAAEFKKTKKEDLRNVFSRDDQNNSKTNKKPTITGLICFISW
ncbi:hypothetical protein KY289_033725 [Solanum tuberosum]|nr:hypothetical protein KY289_033725 [Solanum tuberosum]